MLKILFAYLLIATGVITYVNTQPISVDSLEKPVGAAIYIDPSLTYKDLLNPFTISRPLRSVNFEREFKIGDFTFAWGNYVKDHFELAFEDHRLNTTATKYLLLPSNDAIFIIRNYKNRIIGYLRLNHSGSFFKNELFKIPSTTLFNDANEPLFETKYSSGIGNFRSKNHAGKTITSGYILGGIFPRYIEVGLSHPQFLVANVPENLFLSQLQLHSSSAMIQHGAHFIPAYGCIPIEKLRSFIESSYEGDDVEILTNNKGHTEEEAFSIPKTWKELKKALKSITPKIPLSKTEKEAIASTLSDRFEDVNGNVDPQEILDAIHELSDEQKNVILDIVDSFTDDSISL